jgi:hypothetical protein
MSLGWRIMHLFLTPPPSKLTSSSNWGDFIFKDKAFKYFLRVDQWNKFLVGSTHPGKFESLSTVYD